MAAAAAAAARPSGLYTDGRRSCATTSTISLGRGSDSSRTGAVTPASRNSTPSSTRATPNQVAPPASAARPTATDPCP